MTSLIILEFFCYADLLFLFHFQPSDSRVHEILNRMNANGRHYELRERNDSTPGRRVYVISPTGDQSNHMGPRGRVFSRATSQLSSIAEESNEDGELIVMQRLNSKSFYHKIINY